MKRLGNEGGFSFLEITIALGIIMILVSALVPVVGKQLDKAKIAIAKDDVQLIASAIADFKTDTGVWPMWSKGSATGIGDDRYAYLISKGGTFPANFDYGSKYGTGNKGYAYLEDMLVYNTPYKGWHISNRYPDSNSTSTTPWMGPYISLNKANKMNSDPWGHKYIVNTWALYDDLANNYKSYEQRVGVVISAGPNGKLETEINNKSDNMELQNFEIGGDDIACIIK